MDIPILYEDENIVAINKPPGLIVHSDGRTEEPSVADWVIEQYPDMANVGEPWVSPQGQTISRPGIVHRLDRVTSGVLLLARNHEAYVFLKDQFQNRTLEKEYRAFVYGKPKLTHGVIEKEIVRIRSIPPRWGVKRASEEKKHRIAITEWNLVDTGVDEATGEAVSFVAMFPKTGRTHQLRVHFKDLGFPIVCDPLYAPKKACVLGFSRTALHAFRISITLQSGEKQSIEAPLPEDFKKAKNLLNIA